MTLYGFAAVMGAFFMTMGLLGVVPALLSAPLPGDPALAIEEGYGYLFGLFPINVLHNLGHLYIGIGGLLVWRHFWSPQSYAKFIGAFYGLLAVLALVPALQTMLGLVPIFGHNIWLHALSAALGIYFGWFYAPSATRVGSRRVTA